MDVYYATTTPGLEQHCAEEIRSLLQAEYVREVPGGVVFPCKHYTDVLKLKSVDCLSAFVTELRNLNTSDFLLQRLREYPMENIDDEHIPFQRALQLYYSIFTPKTNTVDFSSECLRYRVTCTRSGKHTFTSPQAAGNLGFGIGNRFTKWKVDLKNYELEFVLHIHQDTAVIGLCLAQELSNRNRAPPLFDVVTALRPSTAYLLCQYADIRPYMTVCDPMCGIGTIPIEGSLSHPNVKFIGGDIFMESIQQARENWRFSVSTAPTGTVLQKTDFFVWDASKLPLADKSVDVFICDLPFGMRHGTYRQTRKLMPKFMAEVHRSLTDDGKAILLTIESKQIRKNLNQMDGFPQLYEHSSTAVSIGGYIACLFDIRKVAKIANT